MQKWEFKALNFRYSAYRYEEKWVGLNTEQKWHKTECQSHEKYFIHWKEYSFFFDNGNAMSYSQAMG